MLGALISLLLCLGREAYAHMKPYDHPHVGFLHPEELTVLLLILAVGLLLLGYGLLSRHLLK